MLLFKPTKGQGKTWKVQRKVNISCLHVRTHYFSVCVNVCVHVHVCVCVCVCVCTCACMCACHSACSRSQMCACGHRCVCVHQGVCVVILRAEYASQKTIMYRIQTFQYLYMQISLISMTNWKGGDYICEQKNGLDKRNLKTGQGQLTSIACFYTICLIICMSTCTHFKINISVCVCVCVCVWWYLWLNMLAI